VERDRAEECRTLARIMPSEAAAATYLRYAKVTTLLPSNRSGLRVALRNPKSMFSKDEVRRIAANIAELPELLSKMR